MEEDIEIDGSDLDDSVVAEEHQAEAIKKLKEKLVQAEAKAKEYLDGWQRSQADFVNIRKRDDEAKADFLKFANQRIFEELIPVLDSFNIALSQGHKDLEPLYNQLSKVLKDSGLEIFDPVGEKFDPREHEALSIEKTDKEGDDHKIVEVMQKGYRLHGRVVRPAKVRIAEFTSK